jgi:LPPG:FO 2-phospho-L-lactate transferase
MRSLGREPTSTGIAREYGAKASKFVLDAADATEREAIEALGYRVLVTDTLMPDVDAAAGLARRILEGCA